jgi:SAM-dependent methyltransferase
MEAVPAHDARMSSPSALRNRGPILEVLRAHLPPSGTLLEVASGTGEHVVHFAGHLPGWKFQPSDLDADRRASVDAWAQGHARIRPAIPLDTTGSWPAGLLETGLFDAVLCVNMIHIAPWAATIGLVAGAASVLRPGGSLVLYGPFLQDGVATAPGNIAFDADLRARDPSWGIRDLASVRELAITAGFAAPCVIAMPANNLSVVFTFGKSPGKAGPHARS